MPAANVPALHVRYATVMSCKAMTKKPRHAVGLADPVPPAAVLADPLARSGG